MVGFLASLINLIGNVLIVLVIVDSIVSFFLDPYHPVRATLDRLVNPLLAPIRRFVPLIGMLDLSPLILIILIEILSGVLVKLIYAL